MRFRDICVETTLLENTKYNGRNMRAAPCLPAAERASSSLHYLQHLHTIQAVMIGTFFLIYP